MTAPALIGLDWGTSRFRGYLIAAGGGIVDRRDSDAGILNIADGRFAEAFHRQAADWRAADPALPVVASGMIGSRQGWHEVAYADCPAGVAALAAGLAPHDAGDGTTVHFVPGLTVRAGDVPDVMRGEETQIVGAGGADDAARLFVLPGSHSKWARVAGGRILDFATFMTGEVYAALRGHTILGRTMTGEGRDDAAFARGIAAGYDGAAVRGGLLRRLFGVRTLALFDELAPDAGAAYLSGLLIGAELREALGSFAMAAEANAIVVIGRGELADLYRAALASVGVPADMGPADAAAVGHWRIARAAGLVGEAGA